MTMLESQEAVMVRELVSSYIMGIISETDEARLRELIGDDALMLLLAEARDTYQNSIDECMRTGNPQRAPGIAAA